MTRLRWPLRRGPVAPDQAEVEREVQLILEILRRDGPLHGADLRRRVEAELGGPGHFGAALSAARRSGRVHRAGRRSWAASQRGP